MVKLIQLFSSIFLAFILAIISLSFLLFAPLMTQANALSLNLIITKFIDTNDGICNSDCSLREAIFATNNTLQPDIINLEVGTYTLSITGTGENIDATGDLDITSPLTIIGKGADQTIIDAQGIDRVFDIQIGTGTVVISGVTIINGYVSNGNGGGIYNSGADLWLINTIVKNNVVTGTSGSGGGGVYVVNGNVTLSGGQIINNSASGSGGGVFVVNGTFTQTGVSTIGYNSAFNGGGIYVNNGNIIINGGQIISNSARAGGGVYVIGGTFTQTGVSTIGYNSASGSGGGIYVDVGKVYFSGGGQVNNNIAQQNGGGIYVGTGSITLSNTVILTNTANNGGGLYLGNNGSIIALNGCIVNNSSTSVVNTWSPTTTINATGNWWGVANGPSGVGVGNGDSVSTGVNNTGFLTTPILGCPMIQTDIVTVTINGPTTAIVGNLYNLNTTISPVSAELPIIYTWSPVPNSGQGTATVTYNPSINGSQTIKVTAQNSGGIVTATHNIIVNPANNSMPEVKNITINLNGTNIFTLYYDFSDSDGDQEATTLIRWSRNGMLQPGLNNKKAVTDSSVALAGEKWCVTIQPHDGKNYGLITKPVCITIAGGGGTPITVNKVTITTTHPIISDDLVLDIELISANNVLNTNDVLQIMNKNLEVRWYRNSILQNRYANTTTIASKTTMAGETWQAIVRYKNGQQSGFVVKSNLIIVNPVRNFLPEVANSIILPESPKSGNSLKLSYRFTLNSRPEDKKKTRIRWYRNNILQPRFNNSDTIDSIYTQPGDKWHATISPNDGYFYGITKKTGLVLVNETSSGTNTLPEIRNQTVSPVHPGENDPLSLSYIYLDADGDKQGDTKINWYVGMNKNITRIDRYNGMTVIPASNTLVGQTWQAVIIPHDGKDYGIGVFAPSVTITKTRGNTPPNAIDVYIAPQSPGPDNNLEARYTFTDADGDPDWDTKISWTFKNSTSDPELHFSNGNNTSIINSTNTTVGQIWCVTITPDDGKTNGQGTAQKTCVTITNFNNTNPTIQQPLLKPSPPIPGNEIELNYIYNDNDNDTEGNTQIRWSKNKQLQSVFNDLTFIPSSAISRGDTWSVNLVPVDSLGGMGSKVVDIEPVTTNRLPIITTASISPTKPQPGGVLYVNQFGFTDEDNNPEAPPKVNWFRNNQYVSGYSSALPKCVTKAGESWKAIISPFDGLEYGQEISTTNSVLISGTENGACLTKIYLPVIFKKSYGDSPPPPTPVPSSPSICNPDKFYEDNDRFSNACGLEINSSYQAKADDLHDVYLVYIPKTAIVYVEVSNYTPQHKGKIALYKQVSEQDGTKTGDLIAIFPPTNYVYLSTTGILKAEVKTFGWYYIQIYSTKSDPNSTQIYNLQVTYAPWYENFGK